MPLDCTYESIIKLNIELSVSKVSVKTGYHSKYRNICGSIEPVYAPSRFVTGRRFFNTDRPSDFVPMAFIIYTCARYPQTQARASIDEEKFVEAENKKKKRKKKKEGDRREESEITSRLGDRTFLFLFLFFFSKYDAFYGDDDRTGWKLEWPNRGKFSRSTSTTATRRRSLFFLLFFQEHVENV